MNLYTNTLKQLKYKVIPVSALLLSSYVLYLFYTNNLKYYINPNYIFFTLSISLVTFFISILGLLFYKDHLKNTARVMIAISTFVIVFLGIIIPPTSLTSNTALRRGLENEDFFIGKDPNIKFSTFGNDDRSLTIGTWLKLFTMNPEPTQYVGRKVEVIGFYHQNDTTNETRFIVGRYVITCCSIDARPVGIYATTTTKQNFNEGDWIKVTGEFELTEINNKRIVIIKVSNIEKTAEPKEPYIY